jgi:hypothetical protein
MGKRPGSKTTLAGKVKVSSTKTGLQLGMTTVM